MAMTLGEAYKKGIIKKGDYIKYIPRYRNYCLSKSETGWDSSQYLKTEKFNYQFMGVTDNYAILVADGVTEKIGLRGKTGYENGIHALERFLHHCYSSEKLNAIGFLLTESHWKMFARELEKCIIMFWLGTTGTSDYSNGTNFGIFEVCDDFVRLKVLHSSSGNDGSHSVGVRPAILMSTDNKIDEKDIIKVFKID